MNHVYVETCGAGPDLVLLHGWAMHSGVWNGVRDRLAQQYRLHLVDLPGHGFSAALTGTGELATLQRMAEAVAQALPARSIVCGWSLGGQVAIELALRQPECVRQLVLVSTTPSFVQREDWQWGMEATLLQQFTQDLDQDCTATLQRFCALQVRGSSNAGAVLAQLHAILIQRALQRDEPAGAGLQAGLQILLATDLRAAINKIAQPVTLLHGENDAITNAGAARWMNRQLQNSKLVMLPRCGHAPFLSHPEQFMEIMRRSLNCSYT